MDFPARC